MSHLVAHRFRLRTTASQEAWLRRVAGCRRFVWNKALVEQKTRFERGEKYAGFAAMCRWLTAWRADPDTAFLRDAPIHALQSALKDLDLAYRAFFKKQRAHPTFQRRGEQTGFREPDVACFTVDEANARVRIPKLGWVRYRKSRDLAGEPRSLSVTHDTLGWHVSIVTETATVPANSPSPDTMLGIDRGVTWLYADSSGRKVAPLSTHKQKQVRIKRYQRGVARKLEAARKNAGLRPGARFPKGFAFSNRLRRQQRRVADLSATIARQRTDFLHKTSVDIARRAATVVFEDLDVVRMSASAAGTIEEPGTDVQRKRNLNRAMLDRAWGELRRQTDYKVSWRGGTTLGVPAWNTSRRCHACGHTEAANRVKERFACRACGHTDHADVNAAKNILAAGHAVLALRSHADAEKAPVVNRMRSSKRQPTGVHA